MNLDLFNNLTADKSRGGLIKQFIEEIKQLLKSGDIKADSKNTEIPIKESYSTDLNLETKNTKARPGLKQEGCIYIVDVDGRNSDGSAYLINTETGIIEVEKDFSKEMDKYVYGDHVFIFENGQYVFNDDLTWEYMNNFGSIPEAEKAQAKFSKEFNNRGLDSETTFKISSGNRKKDKTVTLSYKNKDGNIEKIEAPSILIPYFVYDFNIFKYDTKLECFYKDN